MTKSKKKREARKSRVKKEAKSELKIPSYFNYIFGILVLAIFALSLYLRTVMPYDSVFRNGLVLFAADDSVFHMRLVENTLKNFPRQIFYDAFTIYPYGAPVHWGPLFSQMIAGLSLIAGMGSYNMQTVNTIGAFFPSVLGALVVFPVYFIGKLLYNRSAGLFAAFMIAVLPGQFFQRSTLGFTDNHVAEVLFSTATTAFFILAAKAGREKNIKFSDLHLREKSVLYSIFAGIMLASYQLSWPGAPFFALIISIFILIQYIIDDMQGKSTDYLAIAAVPMFLIDLISVLPYVNPEYGYSTVYYSWFHVAVALAGMGLPIALSIISSEIRKRDYSSYYYPFSLGVFFLLAMLGMKIILPQMYSAMVGAPAAVFEVHTGGANTIAEATSIFASQNAGMLWDNFPVTGFLQNDNFVVWFIIAVLVYIGYRVAKNQRPEEMLFLVWSIVMLLAIYGQNRWAYYFAVNIALMIGYAGATLSERMFKWGWLPVDNLKNIGLNSVLSLVMIVALVLFFSYPSLVATALGTKERPPLARFGGGDPSGGGYAEWLDALFWMRNNTPDPGLDYYAVYNKPKNSTYPYPDSAYGVMSWWDYGHIITYWAHRIPNANPFQAGIGGGSSHAPGASTFLTAESEEEADRVLDKLGINGKPGARYIVSNAYMAYNIQNVFAVWDGDPDVNDPALWDSKTRPDPRRYYESAIDTSKGRVRIPGLKSFLSMEARLHIFDGNGLKRYRLVHESPPNPYTLGGYPEEFYKRVYNFYGGNISLEYTGLVKVFEYVKGAKITGKAPVNETLSISATIKTNQGRTFPYFQEATSNGSYEFIVPYSTGKPVALSEGGTLFDTAPTGPYIITLRNTTKQVSVGEQDVLEGRTISVDF